MVICRIRRTHSGDLTNQAARDWAVTAACSEVGDAPQRSPGVRPATVIDWSSARLSAARVEAVAGCHRVVDGDRL